MIWSLLASVSHHTHVRFIMNSLNLSLLNFWNVITSSNYFNNKTIYVVSIFGVFFDFRSCRHVPFLIAIIFVDNCIRYILHFIIGNCNIGDEKTFPSKLPIFTVLKIAPMSLLLKAVAININSSSNRMPIT